MRGLGGQSVAPPSVHPDGSRYQWANDLPIAEITTADLVEHIERIVYGAMGSVERVASPPPTINQARARAWLAKRAPAVAGNAGDAHTWTTVLHVVRGFQLDEEDALAALGSWNQTCRPPWKTDELRRKVRDAVEKGRMAPKAEHASPIVVPDELCDPRAWMGSLITSTSKKGTVRPLNCLSNLVVIFSQHPEWFGSLAYDSFTHQRCVLRDNACMMRGETWSDDLELRATSWVEREIHDIRAVSDRLVGQALMLSCKMNERNSLRDWLLGLVWDGTPRLETMLTDFFGCDDSEYVRDVSTKFMISAVARGVEPGCKVDTMLILEGNQGTRKSTGIEVLFGPEKFLPRLPTIGDRDCVMQTVGRHCVEVAELEAFTRSSSETIKGWISTRIDTFVPKYVRNSVSIPRQFVLVGTTNDTEYLADPTGGRRFWPVKCVRPVQYQALKASRELLWAEAVAMYRAGEPWWFEDERATRDEQATRYIEDPWMLPICDFLRGKSVVWTADILEHLHSSGGYAAPRARWNPREAGRVSAILTRCGWKKAGPGGEWKQ
jgi:predicted P-loop ATPase